MKNNKEKSQAVKLMLSATLEEYLMHLQKMTLKMN
jgi:hypothetical protein